jgi:hypothetical protein
MASVASRGSACGLERGRKVSDGPDLVAGVVVDAVDATGVRA